MRPFLLVLVLLTLLAGTALAEGSADTEGMGIEELEGWIQESPEAVWVMAALRFGAAGIGLLLLVLLWIRRDRIRAGLLPAPPTVSAVAPFSLAIALLILVGTFVALGVASMALARTEVTDGAIGMLVTQGMLIVMAVLVIARRFQIGAEPRRSVPRVVWLAFAAFFVASAIVIPVMMANVLLLRLVEYPLTVYKPVEEVIKGSGTSSAWMISLLAAVLAPIAEESLFRGMLYPALRNTVNTRGAALLAAVVTSAVFALMHPHPPSWLPLFALAMVLTWVFERTNSLGAVIGAHALWNIATLAPLLIRGAA